MRTYFHKIEIDQQDLDQEAPSSYNKHHLAIHNHRFWQTPPSPVEMIDH
jgi:hypothetical protein